MIQSLQVDMMIRLAQLVNPGYDIYQRLGLKEGMPVSNHTAAQCIVADLIERGYFVDFVETLIRVDNGGYMGRSYALKGLDDVINGVVQGGYSFDQTTGRFFENQRERISENWGRLREGNEQQMTVLRLDIAGNSVLVRQNSAAAIQRAYAEMRTVVSRAVIGRLGRLWSWEGDGALAVFMFGHKERAAVFCGMDILHELFFFNKLKNPLSTPIKLRLGVHIGTVRYHEDAVERLKNDAVKQAVALEGSAAANSMAVSHNLFISMDKIILDLFTPEKTSRGGRYRQYSISQEKI
jgi:class 3 adenylate cyclase